MLTDAALKETGMSDDITHDLDLLDDWLAGKGYGEEAGLVLRAMTLINAQARELRELRAALKPFAEKYKINDDSLPDANNSLTLINVGDLRAAAAALKEDQ